MPSKKREFEANETKCCESKIIETTLTSVELDSIEQLVELAQMVNDLGIHIFGPDNWEEVYVPKKDDIKSFTNNVNLNNAVIRDVKEKLDRICSRIK